MISGLLIILITILCTEFYFPSLRNTYLTQANNPLVPPVGVFMIAGCGADLFVNVCLTILGYFPGRKSCRPFNLFDRCAYGRSLLYAQTSTPSTSNGSTMTAARRPTTGRSPQNPRPAFTPRTYSAEERRMGLSKDVLCEGRGDGCEGRAVRGLPPGNGGKLGKEG